ncbi:HAD family hydrolase [Streptomyces sp. NPDC058052]|uniref:HAD family hydrolase n=1 Tax=Streptomyces sp. NPDC058052 TaxID=3346316 RepID=UPI0036E0BB4E
MTDQRHPIDTVVFDAMGVLYRSADDVAELLVPYATGKGSPLDAPRIGELYTECSLGRFDTDELWRRLGVSGASDEEYCALHELTEGTLPLLERLTDRGVGLACLSNDVSEWSVLLRRRFALDKLIPTWVISGDIGARKPAPESFGALLATLDVTDARRVLFVDDRKANVEAARAAGLTAAHFGTGSTSDDLREVRDMNSLQEVLDTWIS